ncbi:hypothetical protein RB653_004107 [Dictyostelium firmibasis]|uniref:Uncharacterized protein n=1 Tax=Dictyostelium firmibasis TaxID=79012 RepID=A0AAN7U5U0_9MYCE
MNKIILVLLVLYVYIFSSNNANNNIVLGGLIECTCYTDSKSTLTSDCGTVATAPCQSISQSILSCSQYDSLTMNIEAGTYNINQATFGSITNKTISILNNDQTTSSVIIDLSNAIDSFIRIEPKTINDVNTISFTGITFQGGNKPYGPILFNNGTSVINLEITNCMFTNNTATLGGGSIAITQTNKNTDNPTVNSKINVSQSTFKNSILSKVSGGVFYIYDLNVEFTIDQSSFDNITALASGGIIYMRNGLLKMTNSIITSSYSNAAFFLSSEFPDTQFQFSNVNFSNALGGLGFAGTGFSTQLSFTNCNFLNNVNTGSIIGLNTGLISVQNCLFSNNNNKNSPGNSGGAITLVGSSAEIKNSLFINNYAQSGGAININSTVTGILDTVVSITSSQFINNTAVISGGAIALNSNGLTINNTIFTGNYVKANDHGPSVYCSNSDIRLSNSTFKFNQTDTRNQIGIDCSTVNYGCTITDSSKDVKYVCTPPTDSNGDDDDSKDNGDHGKLTTGQKVAIAFGVIGGVFLIVIVAILIARKVKKSGEYKPIGL